MTPTDDWSTERIGLYTRLSQDRAGATSIQRQDDEARDVIDLKGGVLAREPYSDPDASAWKERVHRPGFDRLLADADAGDVTLVVVWACDRLTRQGEQMETFLKLMRKRGLKLYSVKEGYIDLSNGAIMPKLITWKSEMESERISMRVKSANRRLARAGAPHPGGKQAYGQRRRRRPDGTAVLAVEPDEAEIVREMARRLLAHESLRSIAADLVARGVATSTGGVIGLVAIPLIAWALSERRGAIAPARLARILLGGRRAAGADRRRDAERAGRARRVRLGGSLVAALQSATGAGMRLVFGYLAGGPAPFETVRPETSFILAFQALPLILVISALSKLLYHWGVLQKIVHAIGWVLQRSLGVTGPVGTSAAANVFVGMVEAPLLVRPYLADHEPRRPVRHHDGRHGRRGRHRAGALRHHPGAAAAGRGGAPDRRLRHQRAGRR